MDAPGRFADLPDYAFPRLRRLLDSHAPGGDPVPMSIGEPMHPMPPFVGEVIAANLQGFQRLPAERRARRSCSTRSRVDLRRYGVQVAPSGSWC
jgi:hypothetical protein